MTGALWLLAQCHVLAGRADREEVHTELEYSTYWGMDNPVQAGLLNTRPTVADVRLHTKHNHQPRLGIGADISPVIIAGITPAIHVEEPLS